MPEAASNYYSWAHNHYFIHILFKLFVYLITVCISIERKNALRTTCDERIKLNWFSMVKKNNQKTLGSDPNWTLANSLNYSEQVEMQWKRICLHFSSIFCHTRRFFALSGKCKWDLSAFGKWLTVRAFAVSAIIISRIQNDVRSVRRNANSILLPQANALTNAFEAITHFHFNLSLLFHCKSIAATNLNDWERKIGRVTFRISRNSTSGARLRNSATKEMIRNWSVVRFRTFLE